MNNKKNLVFTICSANYLAQAITLGKSLENTNPGVEFRIYMVDRLEGREEVRKRVPFKLIEIENVPVTDFEGMILRYNVVELNTSVKPYIFHHILKEEPDLQKIVYFDPDIMVFYSLNHLFESLDKYNIVVTPHILTPSDENKNVQPEKNFITTGIFNLGFISVKRSDETLYFIEWWKNKLVHQGYCKPDHGLFFDQLWINLAPIYFDKVHIEKNRGYNMAPWNLHERTLTKENNYFVVNDNQPLLFFHFSKYNTKSPWMISPQTFYNLENRPDLREIAEVYHSELLKNGDDFFKKILYSFDLYKIQIMRKNALNNSNYIMKKFRKIKHRFEDRFKH